MNKRTNGLKDEWKDENYVLLSINAGGITKQIYFTGREETKQKHFTDREETKQIHFTRQGIRRNKAKAFPKAVKK